MFFNKIDLIEIMVGSRHFEVRCIDSFINTVLADVESVLNFVKDDKPFGAEVAFGFLSKNISLHVSIYY